MHEAELKFSGQPQIFYLLSTSLTAPFYLIMFRILKGYIFIQ